MILLRVLVFLAPVLTHAIENDYHQGRVEQEQSQRISSSVLGILAGFRSISSESYIKVPSLTSRQSFTATAPHGYKSIAGNLTNHNISITTQKQAPSHASSVSLPVKNPSASPSLTTASFSNSSSATPWKTRNAGGISTLPPAITTSVNIVVPKSASSHSVGHFINIAGQNASNFGPSVSGSVSSRVTQNVRVDVAHSSSDETNGLSRSSRITFFLPHATKVAKISKTPKASQISPSSCLLFSSSAMLNTSATSHALNTTASSFTTLVSGVTNQAAFSMPSTTLVSIGTSSSRPQSTYSVPITTTITSPPSTYFTSTASNNAWTTDTTTVINGTILPVLVGCKVCGGLHHGVVIFGLGGGKIDPVRSGCVSRSIFGSIFGCGTEFNFPSLPPFIIGTDGTPVEESGSSDDDGSENDCEDVDSCSLPTSKHMKTQASTSWTSVPTETSTSLSSTISKIVTSTSGGLSKEYMVFPTAGATSDELTALAGNLTDELGADNVLSVSLDDAGIQNMYVIYTSESFASNLQRLDPKIDSVVADVPQTIWDDPPNGTLISSLLRRDDYRDEDAFDHSLTSREIVDGKEVSAPPELRFVSQPKGVDLDLTGDNDDLGGNIVPYYAYDTAAGEGITIYIIDSGANPSNSDYIGMLGSKRWLEIDEDYWEVHAGNIPNTETDEQDHGSCVTSKAAGIIWGVAKKANIVIAKVGVKQTDTALAGWYIYLLQKVREDVLKNNLQGKAVVNLSGGLPLTDSIVIASMKTAVESLLKNDVVVVTTAGNNKLVYPEVSKYPALFASTLTDLIVVGAVYTDGTATEFSQGGPLVTVCAPAAVKAGPRILGISCASSRGTGKTNKPGTSFAAPQVAGLAAYFLSTVPSLQVPGQVAQRVKNYIVSKAYSRKRGPIAIFNDFDFRTGRQCAVVPPRWRIKRDVASVDVCLQSYPPIASTSQTKNLQSSTTTRSSTTGLVVAGDLPVVLSGAESPLSTSGLTKSFTPTPPGSTINPNVVSSSAQGTLNIHGPSQQSTQSHNTSSTLVTSPTNPAPITQSIGTSILTSTNNSPDPALASSSVRTENPTTTSTHPGHSPDIVTVVLWETTTPPPPPRKVVTSVVYVPPFAPASTTSVAGPVETFGSPLCIEDYWYVYESECWEFCWGGTCAGWSDPFGNSPPMWMCEGCPGT